jgi:aerobic-type carbon monoxide dehydrogenase small subunit (CoxS/CutS family)
MPGFISQAAAQAGTPPTPLELVLRVNGTEHRLTLDPRTTLLDALREHLHLIGSKKGCGLGQCGACTVLMDGKAVKSCTLFAVQGEGHDIKTIEDMAAADGTLHPIQQAFWDEHGLQCGFCTPGFIMAAAYLLEQNPNPSDEEIRKGLEGNLCRCTGYVNIVKAIETAARTMSGEGRPEPAVAGE